MKVPFLDLSRFDKQLQEELKKACEKVLVKGVFSGGEEVDAFCEKVKSKIGSKFAIPCANGTDALELALRALRIGSGDEVIVPALTWVSTAEAVIMVGAKPVFWDTDSDGLLAENWEKAITPKTKAVIPVHLYGKMPNMGQLCRKAKANSLYVIEDAAQAFGAIQNGKAAGTFGDVGCLSFYPTKNLGALGEAGMCLTQNPELFKKISLLINHGQPSRDEHVMVGRNSRIDSLQAGFLNVFLSHFDHFQNRRKVLANRYLIELSDLKDLRFMSGISEEDHSVHLFPIFLERRDELKKYLSEKGIGTAIHYPNILPEMFPYRVHGQFSISKNISATGLSLPLNPWLEDHEHTFIIECVRAFFSRK